MPEILYSLAFEGDGSLLIDWGNTPGWLETHREFIDSATRVTLVPKDRDGGLPVVTVALTGDRRWVASMRVLWRSDNPNRVRVYVIGWQDTVKGVNVKALTWVYPNGAIECSDEPTLWKHYL